MSHSVVRGRLASVAGGEGPLRMSRFAIKIWARRLLGGPGSSVTEWEPNEPRGLLKSSGFAVGLKACEVETEGWDCISRSGLADLDL